MGLLANDEQQIGLQLIARLEAMRGNLDLEVIPKCSPCMTKARKSAGARKVVGTGEAMGTTDEKGVRYGHPNPETLA